MHPVDISNEEIKAWVDGRLVRSRLALLRGRLTIGGRLDLAPLDVIEVKEVVESVGGNTLISAVTHRVDVDGWQTELQLGLPAQPFAAEPAITDIPAAGLLPAASGLCLGIVDALDPDPLGHHRIKVLLSVLSPDQGAVWARMARPDAGHQRGMVFGPQRGDEVVVGFLNGDPRQAIVLGALHSASHPPARGRVGLRGHPLPTGNREPWRHQGCSR